MQGAVHMNVRARSAVLLTNHAWPRASQLNVHFIARALARAGWRMTFITAVFGPRPAAALGLPVGAMFPAPPVLPGDAALGIETGVFWHRRPRLLLARAALLLRGGYGGGIPGPLAARIADASLIIFDSGEPLAIAAEVRALNPSARLVLRMSDLPGVHSGSGRAEVGLARMLPRFDVISVPAAMMAESYDLPSVRLHPHGVEATLFDAALRGPSPYDGGPNAVFSGWGRLDLESVVLAAEARPGIAFHILGPFEDELPRRPNLHLHGGMPFERTLPFVAHADIGLHFVKPKRGAESFSDSLKVMQYAYCRLPIVAPGFLNSTRPNLFAYTPADRASIGAALDAALAFDRAGFEPSGVWSWDEMTAALLADAGF